MMGSQNPTSSAPATYSSLSEGFLTPANVIILGAVMCGTTTFAVALRFYARIIRASGIKADDWFILASLVLTVGMGVMIIVGAAIGGLSRPTPQGNAPKAYFVTTDRAEVITEKIFWIFNLIQSLSFGTAKLSMLYFYRRIFRGRVFNVVSITMIIIIFAWSTAFFLSFLFRCGTKFWALWAPLKYLIEYCYMSTPQFIAFASSDVVTDCLILAIPLYWTWQLKLSTAKRIGICAIFLVGAVTIAAGITRLVIYVHQEDNPYSDADGIGHLTTEIWWSMLEMGLSIIVACMPSLSIYFRRDTYSSFTSSLRSMLSLTRLRSHPSTRASNGHETRQESEEQKHKYSSAIDEDAFPDGSSGEVRV